MVNSYQKAIDLYNSTLEESLSRNEFISRLKAEGLSEEEALMAFMKIAYQVKFPHKV